MGITIVAKKQKKQAIKDSELGKVMRAKRKVDKLTVRAAADMIGMGNGGVSELENGKRSPDWDTLVKIHEGLAIPIEDLVRAAAKDRGVIIAPRTDNEIVNALNARSVAFPDLKQVLRSLEKADPSQYRSFLKMFDVFDQSDDPPP